MRPGLEGLGTDLGPGPGQGDSSPGKSTGKRAQGPQVLKTQAWGEGLDPGAGTMGPGIWGLGPRTRGMG